MSEIHCIKNARNEKLTFDLRWAKGTDNNKTDSWSECRTGSENVNNRLASNKCDNSQSFLIKIFFERFWKVGLKANIVRLIHNYK